MYLEDDADNKMCFLDIERFQNLQEFVKTEYLEKDLLLNAIPENLK